MRCSTFLTLLFFFVFLLIFHALDEGLHPLRAAGLPVLGWRPGQPDGGVSGAGAAEGRDAEDVPRPEGGARHHRRHQHHHHLHADAATRRRHLDRQRTKVANVGQTNS